MSKKVPVPGSSWLDGIKSKQNQGTLGVEPLIRSDDLSQRYMLPPELKPLILKSYETLRTARGESSSDEELRRYLDFPGYVQLPESTEAAFAVGLIRGLAMATSSSVGRLLTWAGTPSVEKWIIDLMARDASPMADLRGTSERYERAISREFSRRAENLCTDPELEVLCEACLENRVELHEGGTVHCSTIGSVCLFEHLPVTSDGRRIPVCFDCAVEAHAVRTVGFGPLHLAEFQEALRQMKETRIRTDDDDLYKNGASVSFYEASVRHRRVRISPAGVEVRR